uniref:TBC1 domain family member 2B n=1 Tax=Nothobranchius furzeri TaxID=105023 RepID=A0A8C6LU92_NOTFU
MNEEEDGSHANSCAAPRLLPVKSLDVAEADGAKEQASKLCGYLNKLSGKGPLRGFKLRWFVYDPRKCYLYYFRSPHDALPLGHIDVADACFMYDVEVEEGQFEIRTVGKEFILKAPNKQVMHYWLQELQQKRWEYNSTRPGGQRDSWISPALVHPSTGLVGKDNGKQVPAHSFACFSLFSDSFGSTFTFDFGRNSSRHKRSSLRDLKGLGRPGRSSESSATECNGGKQSDSRLRLQSQTEALSQMQQEQVRLNEELASQKELVRLLQQTLKTSQCDRSEDVAHLEKLLQDRDEQIKSLCGHMERLSLIKESLQQELKVLKVKVGEMNDQLGMLMETIMAKDEVIIKLSQHSSAQDESGSPTPHREQQELDVLKDSLQGYKSQNKFLNKEILELTELRRNAENREKAIEAKCTAMEAKMCQVESKYLVLLQEVRTPMCSSSEQSPGREVISRLLEDALQVESPQQQEHTIFKPNTVSEYDVYGFKTVPEEEEEEERLVAKVRALELKSLSMTDQEVSVGVKWENFLAGTMNRDLVRSPELKALIRCGVPHEHRSLVWRWCISYHVKKFQDCLMPDYYENLLKMARERSNPASKQIELDLLRTLPNNKHYASPSADGIHKLRNVLLAFSWRNPDIGYCQGLNRLAAIALLYLDQEDAFWTLVAIVEVFMPRDYYTKTLLGSQVDQRVFKDLMNEKLPRLHAHFEQHKVDFSLITFNWFLVVFVDSVVSDILFKIWDAFLFEGPKIMFRFALALFKYKEEDFLKLQDSTAIFKYLRCFTRTILDSRKLMNIAFFDMNPFPMRQIQNRRAFHLEKVRLELTELEAIRQTFLKERETRHDGRSFVSDDEEDN